MAQAYSTVTKSFYDITSGFLIEKSFPKLYRDFVNKPGYHNFRDIYAVPRNDRVAHEYLIQYRGLDRDALDPFDKSDILAEIRMHELEKEGRCIDGFLFDLAAVNDVISYLEDPNDFEIVWARISGTPCQTPIGYDSVGFEPTYFTGDHFSASSDCMMFPRWHGYDAEGMLFGAYFKLLNRHGLFDSATTAQDYLDYYLSFDWTEHDGEYYIAEVFVLQNPD